MKDNIIDELPLFDWKPRFQVIAFPGTKRIGKARHIAAVAYSQNSETALQTYLNRCETTLRKQLTGFGIDEIIIDRETNAFFALVSREFEILELKSARENR